MYAVPYNGGTLLSVWIQPRSSKAMITGFHGDSVKVAVKSPPVEGRANEECIDLLSSVLGLPKRQLAIKSGQRSRQKNIFIEQATPEEVMASIESAIRKS